MAIDNERTDVPSPLADQSSTHTWNGAASGRFAASAMPTPIGSPWPSDPVATSIHGSTGVGWPSSRLRSLRNVMSSSSEIAPAAFNIEYTSGEA